jgi:hypothetical protein
LEVWHCRDLDYGLEEEGDRMISTAFEFGKNGVEDFG